MEIGDELGPEARGDKRGSQRVTEKGSPRVHIKIRSLWSIEKRSGTTALLKC